MQNIKIHTYHMIIMSERITIILDDETIKSLRNTQAKMIQKHNKSVSFSSVINDLLRKQLKVTNF